MLDSSLIEQLKQVFTPLENKIEFVHNNSTHTDHAELLSMLKDIQSTNSLFTINSDTDIAPANIPSFEIRIQSQFTGIRFLGIPNGHEFTSLIIAILNADGKGKLPDELIQKRIRKIKGPIRLKTYISLTCENCPDVVQALNQMALIHTDFHHEMVDGAYTQDEIKKLKIQGVPSVIHNDKLVHSGKISLIDLIQKLEAHFDIEKNPMADGKTQKVDLGKFDVAVIGGGPAGVSAAIYSARKGLSTVLIAEKFGGQVQDTKGIENLISVIYTEGPVLSAALHEHLKHYSVKTLEHRRVQKIEAETKTIFIEGGEILQAASIIVATGAKWRELSVPGEKEHLGQGVHYCPHCDGPFYKGKNVAVVGGGNSGVEAAIDLAGIVHHVTVFEFNETLKADQVLIDKLNSLANTEIISFAQTKAVIGNGSQVEAIEYTDRKTNEIKKLPVDGIFVQIGLLPNSGFIKDIVQTNKFGEIVIDEKCRTNVKGIYAAGDVTTVPFKQIVISLGEGAKAALTSFEDRMYH